MVKTIKHWCWNYFSGDIKKARCRYCPQTYCSGYVARMIKHLQECNKIPMDIRIEIDSKLLKDEKEKAKMHPIRSSHSLINTKHENDLLLIEVVRQHRQLYDKNHPAYSNQVNKTKVWQNVARQAGFESGKKANGRWKSIRAAYVQSKRMNAGEEGGFVYTYKFADELSFLLPFLEPGEWKSSSLDERDGEDQDNNGLNGSQVYMVNSSNNQQYVDVDDFTQSYPVPDEEEDGYCIPTTSFTNTHNSNNNLYVDAEELKPQSYQLPIPADEDKSYCDSIAIFMKKLEPKKKRELKIRMEQLMLEYE